MLFPSWVTIDTMLDIGIREDIPENGSSFVENVLIKARYVHQRTGLNVFADDSGLEVDCLGGAPGIYSARYAGPGATSEMNVRKLLEDMAGFNHRNARFVCVIALIYNNNEFVFEGVVEGSVEHSSNGLGGFGYDPVFTPNGLEGTFAQLDAAVKNRISHRAVAVRKMIQILQGFENP